MSRHRIVALLVSAGLAAPALGVDKSWNSDSGVWSEAASWWPVGVPAPADAVLIGNIGSVENDTVTLDQSPTIAALTINDGMTLRTGNRSMRVNGHTLITGANAVVGPGGVIISYPSRLVLQPVDGLTFRTGSLSLAAGGRLVLDPAYAYIDDLVTIGASSRIEGRGAVDFGDSGTTLNNNGLINAGTGEGLRFRQHGGGLFNLDGATEGGVLAVTNLGGATLVFQGTGLTDPFDSTINMARNSTLNMNLSAGWTATQNAVINVSGSGDTAAPSRIIGGAFTFGGSLNINGNMAAIELTPTELTLAPSARVNIGDNTEVQLGAPAGTHVRINGGEYTLGPSGFLACYGPAVVAGGTFTNTHSGTIAFRGPTEWAGNVTINGYARMSGAASVSAPTVINADLFDMDGVILNSTWLIQSSLTINAEAIQNGPNHISSAITINGGASSRLTVNLDDPHAHWVCAGSLTLGPLAGGAHLPTMRLAGSPVWLTGGVNAPSGRVDISAPVRILDNAVVSVGGELRFRGEAVVFPVDFEGVGTLTSGPSGDLTLETGVSTGTVGLLNQSILRIGETAGIASVDRFENTGAWHVQIGGYAAGSEHDQLIVSGGTATIGGTLVIDVIDVDGDGEVFRPTAGDSFIILTAVGGVSGAFPSVVVTETDEYIYEWSVTSNPNDVTVTLVDVRPTECGADFNHDGVVNSQDFFDFLSQFFIPHMRADINADGVVNSQDFFDFLVMFFSGC